MSDSANASTSDKAEIAALRARVQELTDRLEEADIIFKQARILTGRYYFKEKRLVFPPETARIFGEDEVFHNFPEDYVKMGKVTKNIPQFISFYEAIARGEPHGAANAEIKLASGEFRLYNRIFATVYDAEGKPDYGIVTLMDITEQREQKLAYEKWRYTNRSHKADSAHYYDYNLTTDVLEAIDGNNPSIYPDQNERSFSGVARYASDYVIHPADRAEYLRVFDRESLIRRFRQGTTEIITEHRRRGHDGNYYRAQGVIQLFSDPFNGDVLCFVLIKNLDDVMASMRSRMQSEVFGLLSDSIPGGIIFTHNLPGFPYYFVNNGMLEFTGCGTREEFDQTFQGQAINLIHPEERDKTAAIINAALAEKREFESRHRMIRKDGSIGWVILRGRSGLDHNGREVVVSVMVDITEIITLQNSLEDALKRAEEATRIKSSFLANMSHEIRTPMNGVIGLSELALDDKELTPKTRDFINKIRISAAGLVDIINDILDVSKIESGRMELERTAFSLRDIFKQCETISGVKAGEKGVVLDCANRPRLEKKLIGDPTKIRQVLLNLLSNAVKFTDRGSVKLAATVEKRDHEGIRLRFSVTDTGIGMKPDEIQRVFEPFAQADNSTTRKYGGTGLGLAITKSMVELMGGELEVTSKPGLGSRFSFAVDLDLSTEDESSIATRALAEERMPLFTGEVLVCEDNAINQQVIQEHLSRVGLKVVLTANGALGVEEVALRWREGRKPFDLILMDIHMPVMDGMEATMKIQRMGVRTPVVALTANVMQKDRQTYLAGGMVDFLAKPFSARDLWKILLRFLTPRAMVDLGSSTPDPSKRPSQRRHKDSTIIIRSLGLERAAGNEKLYHKLQSDFVKSNQDTFARLNAAVDAKDYPLAHRIAHTLKGVAGLIGASILADAAYAVERGLQSGKATYSDEQMQTLGMTLQAVLDDLTPRVAERERAGRNTESARLEAHIDRPTIARLIGVLEPLLASGDSQCTDHLDEIREKFAPLGELCTTLVDQIDGYDFDPAQETLGKIRAKLKI